MNQGALAFLKVWGTRAAGVFREMSYFVANFDLGDQTAKQVAIQFADRPTCYEIHTHFAVKLTVVCVIRRILLPCCSGHQHRETRALFSNLTNAH